MNRRDFLLSGAAAAAFGGAHIVARPAAAQQVQTEPNRPKDSGGFFRILTGSAHTTAFPVGVTMASVISNPPGSRPCEKGGSCGVPGLIVVKRLTMQGFIVMDYMEERQQALTDLQSWVQSGRLKVLEDVIDGLENTPQALIGLLAGENRGKRMIRL